jgi:hypothetical protein
MSTRFTYVHCYSQCYIFQPIRGKVLADYGGWHLPARNQTRSRAKCRARSRHVVIWRVPPPEIESAQDLLGVREKTKRKHCQVRPYTVNRTSTASQRSSWTGTNSGSHVIPRGSSGNTLQRVLTNVSEELLSGRIQASYLGIPGSNYLSGGRLVFVVCEFSPSKQTFSTQS